MYFYLSIKANSLLYASAFIIWYSLHGNALVHQAHVCEGHLLVGTLRVKHHQLLAGLEAAAAAAAAQLVIQQEDSGGEYTDSNNEYIKKHKQSNVKINAPK